MAGTHSDDDGAFSGHADGTIDADDGEPDEGGVVLPLAQDDALGQGEIEIEAATAIVDDVTCVGCKQCVASCPYQAIQYLEDKGKAYVQEALCKGCGTCAGTWRRWTSSS